MWIPVSTSFIFSQSNTSHQRLKTNQQHTHTSLSLQDSSPLSIHLVEYVSSQSFIWFEVSRKCLVERLEMYLPEIYKWFKI
ncbi:hypothetical protein L1987_81980 [Smallanthus sonchifolius]|uniref:Uncharacterized protein n=1 Tax=Smallanthus sonchifolius TaxID=185202 RepID=A0ACB8YTJ7_9ASTR|nr:hypothetical protein L1987_81980 [Smallanthus sonchifolius]